ncbi:cation diffusion facilitator family transporter, partial [Pseudomonas sp.]|uniref:cation diffusion facilitator family transporter n=4 Tax=Pseudomonas TaxID=286 RepID=UPI003FD8AB5F
HGHSHGHAEGDEHDDHHEEMQRIVTSDGVFELSIFEEGVPPVFRFSSEGSTPSLSPSDVTVTTIRSDGSRQVYNFQQKAGFLESTSDIPEPHGFKVAVVLPSGEQTVEFTEHAHDSHEVDTRDHNMRAAYIHVMADAAVSVMAIIGLLLAQAFGWLWMDPLAGIVGALVIANWSYGLIRQTGAILVDASADGRIEGKIRTVIDESGDKLVDLHVWRLGPGHLGAVVSLVTHDPKRTSQFYHQHLAHFKGLSHITVEVLPEAAV